MAGVPFEALSQLATPKSATAARELLVRQERLATARGMAFVAPPLALCTDNAAMIAWAGLERMRLDLTDDLGFAPRPRWPLDPNAAPARGAGVKA